MGEAIDQPADASRMRVWVHPSCPAEVTQSLPPTDGATRRIDCARSELSFDPLFAGSACRLARNVILSFSGESLGLKLASVGVRNWVVVARVKPNGPAAAAGIVAGDRILEVGGKTVNRMCWEAARVADVTGPAIGFDEVTRREMQVQSGRAARRQQDVVRVVSSEITRQMKSSARRTNPALEIVVGRHATLTVLNPGAANVTHVRRACLCFFFQSHCFVILGLITKTALDLPIPILCQHQIYF